MENNSFFSNVQSQKNELDMLWAETQKSFKTALRQ